MTLLPGKATRLLVPSTVRLSTLLVAVCLILRSRYSAKENGRKKTYVQMTMMFSFFIIVAPAARSSGHRTQICARTARAGMQKPAGEKPRRVHSTFRTFRGIFA